MRATPLERFKTKHVVERATGCWLWVAQLNNKGYGQFKTEGFYLAHRWSYQHFRGPIPEGMQLDHLCRVRHCVNPWHLEPVTPSVNQLRGQTVAAANAAKTHCPAGHEYTPDNIYQQPTKPRARRCRECARIRDRARSPRARRVAREDVA